MPTHPPPSAIIGVGSRSGTVKGKQGGVLAFMSGTYFSAVQSHPISYTHTPGFINTSISRSEQEKNRQAVVEIAKFYQETAGHKLPDKYMTSPVSSAPHGGLSNPVSAPR